MNTINTINTLPVNPDALNESEFFYNLSPLQIAMMRDVDDHWEPEENKVEVKQKPTEE